MMESLGDLRSRLSMSDVEVKVKTAVNLTPREQGEEPASVTPPAGTDPHHPQPSTASGDTTPPGGLTCSLRIIKEASMKKRYVLTLPTLHEIAISWFPSFQPQEQDSNKSFPASQFPRGQRRKWRTFPHNQPSPWFAPSSPASLKHSLSSGCWTGCQICRELA